MCFKYREKKFGKFWFVAFALLLIAMAVGTVWGGVYAFLHIEHWTKWVLIVGAGLLALFLVLLGLYMILISFSLINSWKSVRDRNTTKGVKDVRLCEHCGRVISKKAQFCEHCGEPLHEGLGMKKCPECKAENSAKAAFCEKCGHKFKN
ncbi:MAG: zinc ribbon domain-containing protein [Clostridia bacterium]|nr:zinc ribbon domain-containing protein [Clostridia bacterium]